MAEGASFRVQDAVVVVPPDPSPGGSVAGQAERVVDSVWLRYGTRIDIVRGDRALPHGLNSSAIVLGCLADNPFVASLYERYATLVDRWYPGPGGWVVQFMASPHRAGAHVLLLGGSNTEGVRLATSSWLQQLPADGQVSWQLQVCLGAEHEPSPVDRIDCLGTSTSQVETSDSALPTSPYESAYTGGSTRDHLLRLGMYGPHADNFHLSRSSQLGLRYLYTGGAEDAQAYRRTLLDEVRAGVVQTLYHYKSIRMFQLWAMLAGAAVFSDDERAEISAALRAYLLQESGIANKEAIRTASKDHEIFSRHVACDALNLWVGTDWLWRQTGEAHWLEEQAVADAYFEAQAGTDVPLTGLTEGYATYLEVYLEWMLLKHPERIAQDRHVRLWAERVIGLCTNNGQLVLGPQTDAPRYPYNLLRKLACVLDDGRYLYVADLRERQVEQGLDRVMQFSAGQAWADDTEAIEPADQIGLATYPMNERLRRWQAQSIDAHKGFDRAVARAGWSPDDDYLMLVGVRSGGKSLPNVGTLAAYERFGQRLITSDIVPLYPRSASPWRHTGVTVSIDGVGAGIAEGAQILQQGESAGGQLLSFEVCAPGHHRWIRTVYWQPSAFVLVVDRVVDETEDSRSCTLGVNWRCGGQLLAIDDGLATLAFDDDKKPGRFFVEVSSSLRLHSATEDYPALGAPADTTPATELMLHGLTVRAADAREIEVATLLHAVSGTHEPCYRLVGEDSRWDVSGGEATHELARSDADGSWVATVRVPKGPADRPPMAAVRRQEPTGLRPLEVGWAADLSAPATVWAQAGHGGMAVGTEAGEVLLLDAEGKVQHSAACGDAITALRFFEADLLIGTRAGAVCRVDAQGQALWRYECQFRPERSFWPWWFRPTPEVSALAGVRDPATGEHIVVAGTGSSSLNFLDGHTGRLRCDVVSPYGLPDRIEARCLQGEAQALVGHNWLTCGSTVQAWTLQAQAAVRYCRSVDSMGRSEEGWDSCGVVAFHAGQLAHDMPPCVVVLRHGAVNQLTLYDEASGDPLWDVGLGGAPVAMCVCPGASGSTARIHVAGQFGEVVQIDGHGKRLTTARLTDQLEGMGATSDGRLALWGGAALLLLTADGARRYRFEGEPLGWYDEQPHQGLVCRNQTQLVLYKADQ